MPARSASPKNKIQPARRITANNGSQARSGGRKPRSASRSSRSGILAGMIQLFCLTYFGRIFIVLLFAAVVVLLNLLVSGNQFDLFFRILGIELILTAAIFWLKFLLKKT